VYSHRGEVEDKLFSRKTWPDSFGRTDVRNPVGDRGTKSYIADELPPAIVVFFTAMFGFFGVNGNDESLSGAHQLVAPGLAMVIAIAVGAMSGIYVANKTV
jgi:hypothetical protein